MEATNILRIDSLAFGGDGIGRLEGKACFVPLAAPGDLLTVHVVEERPSYLRAEISALLEPGPARRTPRCRHFGRCGGCSWQHVDYSAQLAWKQRLLVETMKRIASLDVLVRPIVASAEEYGYRIRTRLHALGGTIGYFERGSKRVVPIEECPILAPEIESHLADARRYIRRNVDSGGIQIAINTSSTGEVSHLLLPEAPHIRRRPNRRALGGTPRWSSAEEDYSFRQVNRFINPELAAEVSKIALEFRPAKRPLHVLDLYCGDGNLSLPLARAAASIEGFDTSEDSIRAASERVRTSELSHVAYSRVDVAEALASLARRTPRGRPAGYLCVIADPPRTGLRGMVSAVMDLGPDLLVYVSCNPPTLARDARELCDAGMRVEFLQPFDMFPQTYHLETVAVFSSPSRRESVQDRGPSS